MLNGQGTLSPNKVDNGVAIKFVDKMLLDPKRCAAFLNRQIIEHPESVQAKRSNFRRIHHLPVTGIPPIAFSSNQVALTIKNAKTSKALGPDGISMIMLKHLVVPRVEFMTKGPSITFSTLIVPDDWKVGIVIPSLEPGKLAIQG